MDKAYVDFKRLNRIDEQKGFFIVRAKRNIKFERVYSKFSNRTKGIIADQIVNLIGGIGKKNYHNKIRKIIFHDDEKNRTLIFMTNNFSAEPQTIALLYKYRWKIEIFFRWIKQNLQIKKFYGTSLNAIETQIWISISTYLLVMIAKKRLQLEKSMQQILHIISFSIIETIELFQIVNNPPVPEYDTKPCNIPDLFKK